MNRDEILQAFDRMRVWQRGDQRAVHKPLLTALDSATQAKDVNVPGWKLHELTGDRAGFLSIAVSGNWRLIFRFVEKDIELVDYLDYH